MIVSSTIASVYSVGLIAIDRFLYILYGLQYQRWIYPNRARLLILLTWVIGNPLFLPISIRESLFNTLFHQTAGIIIGFLPAFGWRGDTNNGRTCWFIRLAPPELVILTTVVGILPLAVIFVLYSIILYHAIQKVIQLRNAINQPTGTVSGSLRMHVGVSNSIANSVANLSPTQNQLSDTEEPLQPPTKKRFFRFLSRYVLEGVSY